MIAAKIHKLAELKQEILMMEGFRPLLNAAVLTGLENMNIHFPNHSFPVGCVHEFLCDIPENTTATSGFIGGILSSILPDVGVTFWLSNSRKIFPPALTYFGLKPERFIFIDLKKEPDVLWVANETLKCPAVSAVVFELKDLSFTASRKLQLAVEQSKATGFALRNEKPKVNPTACISRWKITQLPSEEIESLPGVGFPKWQVELLRMRNGKPGCWQVQWINNQFQIVPPALQNTSENDHWHEHQIKVQLTKRAG